MLCDTFCDIELCGVPQSDRFVGAQQILLRIIRPSSVSRPRTACTGSAKVTHGDVVVTEP